MTREEKQAVIGELKDNLSDNGVIYLTDISAMDAENTSKLRRLCHSRGVKLRMVKNTLLKKAMEQSDRDFSELNELLIGNTSLMLSDTGNVPAKLIKEFRKKNDKPLLKGAWIDESVYLGDDQVAVLADLKSKDELIGDIILLLQSPAKNVISGLSSGGNKLSGILKTLSEREN